MVHDNTEFSLRFSQRERRGKRASEREKKEREAGLKDHAELNFGFARASERFSRDTVFFSCATVMYGTSVQKVSVILLVERV